MAQKNNDKGLNELFNLLSEYFVAKPTLEELGGTKTATVTATATATVTAPAPKSDKTTETKTSRLQLLVTPSLLEKLKEKAKAEGHSLNDVAHSILEGYFTKSYTVKEVAKITDIYEKRVYDFIYTGILKATKTKQRWEISEEHLREFLELIGQ